MIDAFRTAVDLVGGQSATAKAIGASRARVHWLYRHGKRCPAKLVEKVEAATSGAVSRHQLRPDVFGDAA